ncbi:MAG: DMT family transporter [Desulfovibrio sp.]|jgi:drug/metabolite transporter (DMT)-like permease|nr:DMT family transporter [Desulfovibrio sp.]
MYASSARRRAGALCRHEDTVTQEDGIVTKSLTPSVEGHILVAAGAVCISFAGLFVKEAPMPPAMVAFYRLLFGGIVLTLFAAVRGERLLPPLPMLGVMAAAALCFSGDLTSWHECIVRLGPGFATIICNFQVFFLALWGTFMLGEQLSLGHKLAMPVAVIGLMMLLEKAPGELSAEVVVGLLTGIVSALFYSAYILVLRRSQSTACKLPAVANMGIISLLSMSMIGVYCLAAGDSFVVPDLRTLGLLALLGVGCQAAGWVLLSSGLPRMPASRAGLIMLTQPALSFIWDILFYNRPTGAVGYAGAAVTIAAVGFGIAKAK